MGGVQELLFGLGLISITCISALKVLNVIMVQVKTLFTQRGSGPSFFSLFTFKEMIFKFRRMNVAMFLSRGVFKYKKKNINRWQFDLKVTHFTELNDVFYWIMAANMEQISVNQKNCKYKRKCVNYKKKTRKKNTSESFCIVS